MKNRLIALLVLIIIVGIPALAYWYFMHKNVASLEISVGSGSRVRVELRGSFRADFLPLADRLLHYEQDCDSRCVFSPIPPAEYTISITGEGISPLSDTVEIRTGEVLRREFSLTQSLQNDILTTIPALVTEDELVILSEDIQKDTPDVVLIGGDMSRRIWGYRNTGDGTQIGTISDNKFIPIKNFPVHFSAIEIDPYNAVLMAHRDLGNTLLMTLDFSHILETRLPADAS